MLLEKRQKNLLLALKSYSENLEGTIRNEGNYIEFVKRMTMIGIKNIYICSSERIPSKSSQLLAMKTESKLISSTFEI